MGQASEHVTRADDVVTDTIVRQLETMLSLGLPELAGSTSAAVRERVETLIHHDAVPECATATDRIPALLVLPGIEAEAVMPLIREGAKTGYVDMRPVSPDSFEPIAGVDLPDGPYLLLDVDPGRETLGLSPRSAAAHIAEAGRSPLTLEEGVTLLALHPGILRERNCIQMPGSRRNDKRIASLWVTKQGNPRLGWCYEGVPHTWLGSASCAARIA